MRDSRNSLIASIGTDGADRHIRFLVFCILITTIVVILVSYLQFNSSGASRNSGYLLSVFAIFAGLYAIFRCAQHIRILRNASGQPGVYIDGGEIVFLTPSKKIVSVKDVALNEVTTINTLIGKVGVLTVKSYSGIVLATIYDTLYDTDATAMANRINQFLNEPGR